MGTKRRWLALTMSVILGIAGLTACNRDRGVEAAREDLPPSVTPAEQDFTMKTAQGHLAEINMARIALQKSMNNEVKDYANMIQKDHLSALEDLTDLMKHKNVPKPATLSAEIQQDISRMNALSGPEYDREFVNMMVIGHQKMVEMFHDQMATAQNPDVKGYVEDLLPKLEMHLDKARQLQSKLFSVNKPQD
jgi:putative membrane protein